MKKQKLNFHDEMIKQEAKEKRALAKAVISPVAEGDLTPINDLKDAVILNVGFAKTVREGGLAFEYMKDGEIKKLVLGYNDLGTWIEYSGKKGNK